mmetsp:Transcript_47626/g.144034  ORF Transcript_47626/g.144034 Transcript_47626/m.144034 type:complete len:107 (-) Transcript_47626:312-632(-)
MLSPSVINGEEKARDIWKKSSGARKDARRIQKKDHRAMCSSPCMRLLVVSPAGKLHAKSIRRSMTCAVAAALALVLVVTCDMVISYAGSATVHTSPGSKERTRHAQ